MRPRRWLLSSPPHTNQPDLGRRRAPVRRLPPVPQRWCSPKAFAQVASCAVTPDAGEGPFYFDPSLVRSDVTSGRPGAPLEFAVQITRARDCAPLAGVRLDLWQADALGLYSGYRDQPGRWRCSYRAHGWHHVSARDAARRRGGVGAFQDRLPEFVRRPHAAHSFQGADRWEGAGREPDLLPRRDQCRSVRELGTLSRAHLEAQLLSITTIPFSTATPMAEPTACFARSSATTAAGSRQKPS